MTGTRLCPGCGATLGPGDATCSNFRGDDSAHAKPEPAGRQAPRSGRTRGLLAGWKLAVLRDGVTIEREYERADYVAAKATHPTTAAEIVRRWNAHDELVAALRDLDAECGKVAPFAGREGVRGVREAAKFMGACDRARALLARLDGGA